MAQLNREGIMILFRASNLAEMTGIPEFFCDEIGLIQLVGPTIRVVLCSAMAFTHENLLVPKCEIIRPISTVEAAMQQIQEALTGIRGAGMARQMGLAQHH